MPTDKNKLLLLRVLITEELRKATLLESLAARLRQSEEAAEKIGRGKKWREAYEKFREDYNDVLTSIQRADGVVGISQMLGLREIFMKEEKVKYPRTFHLPWSPGATADDKTHTMKAIEDMFGGKHVVITEKMDGENTTIYSTGECHARSLDSAGHPSRDYVRGKAREIGCLGFPKGWRLLGENLYAKHSIEYDLLPDYFVLFGIVDDLNNARPWDEVEEWADLLNIPHAPVVWRGVWDVEKIMNLYPFKSMLSSKSPSEGYVVRDAGSFPMNDFKNHVAKFVRSGHVQPDSEHWMHQKVIPNKRKAND